MRTITTADLKELFPVTDHKNAAANAFFLCSNAAERTESDIPLEIAIRSVKTPWRTASTEDDVYALFGELFTELCVNKVPRGINEPFAIERAANAIAASSRRGAGNTMYETFLFYHGKYGADRIASVEKTSSAYHIFVSPIAKHLIEHFN